MLLYISTYNIQRGKGEKKIVGREGKKWKKK
jgi:hypothetical protein